MDMQENDIEQEIFSKEESYFESETIICKVNEILKASDQTTIKDLLQNIFGEIKLNFINSDLINSFANFLSKIEKENLPIFLTNLEKLNLSSKLLLSVIAEGLLNYLHCRYENFEILRISTYFFLEKMNLKNFRKTEKFIKILHNSLNNTKTKLLSEKLLDEINSNFSRNLNFIYLIGHLLKAQCIVDNQLKTKLENAFTNYYCENILSDDDRDKNLAKQRFLNRFLKFLPCEIIYNRIFPDIEGLLLRSSSNFKFLENVFLYSELEYTEGFCAELFKKYYDYFFNEKTFESAKSSFSKLVNYLDKKILLEKLLNFNFLADKADLNLNLCFYLVNLVYSNDLKLKIKKENIDEYLFSNLTWEETTKLATLVLKKLEMQNENNKAFFESIMESLVKGALILGENLNCDLHQNLKSQENLNNYSNKAKVAKNIQDEFLKQVKKLLSSSSFNYFYQYIFMLLTEYVKRTNIEFDKQLLENIFNQINFVTVVSSSNTKNGLASFSLGFSICSFMENGVNYLNTYKKIITQAITSLINPESFVLLTTNTNSQNAFDFINFTNIMNSFTNQFSNNKNFLELYQNDFYDFLKIFAIIIFNKSNKLYEKVLFRSVISNIVEKDYFNKILNNSFLYIMNNFSLDINNQNNDFLYQKNYEKNSFKKLRKILEYFALFINDFEEKDYLKFLVLSNLNNLNNNSKQIRIKASRKGALYKNKLFSKFQNIQKGEVADLGKHLEEKISFFISEHYKTIASFIFSDMGLFNDLNSTIRFSCLNIIKFCTDKNLNSPLSSFVNYCFEFLDVQKLKFIDQVARYYKKEIDYISFYDLENLVESLKSTEKKYKTSLALNLIPEKKIIIQNISGAQNSQKGAKGKQHANTQQKSSSNANQGQKKQQDTKTEKVEKVNKEIKILEYRNFIENYIFRVGKNFEFNLLKIFDILEVLNSYLEKSEVNLNSINLINNSSHKENLIFAIKKIWSIFSVEFISEGTKKAFMRFFKNNQFAKKFNIEFAMLMFAEANPKKLNNILDQFPNILETFNEKLSHLLNPVQHSNDIEKHKIKIFEYFDFVIIRILFFSILAPEVGNDQKSLSVDNLIRIIETLNKEILNFEDISTLAVGLLKTSYNNENLSNLLEIFMKRCSEENFLTLCNDILDYEYVAKLCFLEQILNLNFSYLRNYKNLVYKIWILIFDENDNISNYATKIWNKFNLYLDNDYGKSQEFKLAFSKHHLVDSMNAANRAYAFILPNQIEFLIKEYENFYESDLDESKILYEEKIKENGGHNFDDGEHKIKRIILFDFIDETIELFSEELKKDVLDFLTKVSEKEFNHEIFAPMNTSIFNIIKSITNESILQNIIELSESNIRSTSSKNSKDINQKALKIILMILNSILMKDNVLKSQKIKSSTVFNKN